MPEQVTLAAPVQSDPGGSVFRVTMLLLDWPAALIQVTLREWNGSGFAGHTVQVSYTGSEATALMTILNSANLAVKSLQRRIIEKLQVDGKLGSGSISGAPE